MALAGKNPSTASTLTAGVSGLSEWVRAWLYYDANSDGTFGAGEDLEYSESNSTIGFSEPLVAGTYFIYIFSYGNNTNWNNTAYSLALSAAPLAGAQDAVNTVANARDMGALDATPRTAIDLLQTGDADFYKFTLSTASTLTAGVSGLSEWVRTWLYYDASSDGTFGAGEDLEYRESASTIDFNEPLAAGMRSIVSTSLPSM